MRAALGVVTLIGTASALTVPPILQQQPVHDEKLRIPTVHESAVMARRIMHLSSIATLITTFPNASALVKTPLIQNLGPNTQLIGDELVANEHRPAEMAGSPIGLMEYYADCESGSGNPTLLAIDIATPYKNSAAGSNVSLHIRWWPTQKNVYLAEADDDDVEYPTPHTPAALPRFSLHGRLEPIPGNELAKHLIPACFMRTHPDSVLWQPGNDIHTSHYVRFVVEHVYWFGGFGDRARIGWLPIEEWRNVTEAEVENTRLPGEKEERRWKHDFRWKETL